VDTNETYQRVIDAAQHGRFTNDPNSEKPVTSMKELFDRAKLWWGPMVRSRYQGKRVFAQYVADHLPPKPNDDVMYLLIEADSRIGFETLMTPQLGDQSTEYLQILEHELFDDTHHPPAYDQFRYFERLFAVSVGRSVDLHGLSGSTLTLRKSILIDLSKLPFEQQVTFLKSHFGELNEDERQTVIYGLSKYDRDQKTKIASVIRPLCTDEQRKDLVYVLKDKKDSPDPLSLLVDATKVVRH
jgi:hypothetical protein